MTDVSYLCVMSGTRRGACTTGAAAPLPFSYGGNTGAESALNTTTDFNTGAESALNTTTDLSIYCLKSVKFSKRT